MDSLQVKEFMAAVNPDVKKDILKKMCVTKFTSMAYDEDQDELWIFLDPEHPEYYSHFCKEDQVKDIITDLFLFIETESDLSIAYNPTQERFDSSLKYKDLLESKTLPACTCTLNRRDPAYKDIFLRKRWTPEEVMDHFIETGGYYGGDLGLWENIKMSQTIAEMQREDEDSESN